MLKSLASAPPLLLLWVTNVFAAQDVQIFTDRSHPVSNVAGHQITYLDESRALLASLTARLPKSPQHAPQAFQQLMATPEGQQLNAKLVKAQQGTTRAWELGVSKLPAVVVDQRYVVYGEANVQRALQLIEQARQ